VVLIALAAQLFAPCAYATSLAVPPQDYPGNKIETVTIKYKLKASDPQWSTGIIPPKAELLLFQVTFEPNPQLPLPDKIKLRVELRRLCGLSGPGGNFLTARYQDHFTFVEKENVPITDRMAEIEMTVHCPSCPRPAVCLFRNSDGDEDPDHLGEGPYEAFITAGNPGPSFSSSATPPSATANTARLIHSVIFSTCIGFCPFGAVPESKLRTLVKPLTPPRKQKKVVK
jgi:hypothetical protein